MPTPLASAAARMSSSLAFQTYMLVPFLPVTNGSDAVTVVFPTGAVVAAPASFQRYRRKRARPTLEPTKVVATAVRAPVAAIEADGVVILLIPHTLIVKV